MDAGCCVAALEEALARYGKPEIFNTNQGSQFTSQAFTTALREVEIRISMDGRGQWMVSWPHFTGHPQDIVLCTMLGFGKGREPVSLSYRGQPTY